VIIQPGSQGGYGAQHDGQAAVAGGEGHADELTFVAKFRQHDQKKSGAS
jgi:hypothetical protein